MWGKFVKFTNEGWEILRYSEPPASFDISVINDNMGKAVSVIVVTLYVVSFGTSEREVLQHTALEFMSRSYHFFC